MEILNIKYFGYNPQKIWNLKGRYFDYDEYQQSIFPQHYWLLEKIKKAHYKNILEVGCGFGRNLNFIIKHCGSKINLAGIDISASLLKKAKKNIPSPVELKLGDICNLPYPPSSFDLVFTHGVLMHIPPLSIERAIFELFRVAKRNVVIIEQYKELPQNKVFERINDFTFAYNYPSLLIKQNIRILEKCFFKTKEEVICLYCQK